MASQGYSNITQVVDNYIGGISQQPHIKRSVNQFEVCENFYPDPMKGLVRRPPTTFFMGGSESYSGYNTIYDPGDGHKYIINIGGIHNGTNIKIIHIGTRTEVYNGTLSGYLTGATKDDIVIMPYMDTIFVLNRKKVPAMCTFTPESQHKGLVVTIKGGHYSRNYHVLNGWIRTPNGSEAQDTYWIQPNNIATALINGVPSEWIGVDGMDGNTTGYGNHTANPNIIESQYNNVLVVLRNTGLPEVPSILTAYEDSGGQDMSVIDVEKPVTDIKDLPKEWPIAFFPNPIKISGGNDNSNDYYLLYDYAQGRYVETRAINISYMIDPVTMPFKITRNSWNSFTLSQVNWYDREVGDNDSNPVPSFIGQPIKDMCIYNSRLCLMTGSSICISRSNLIEDFWFSSATDITDDDPIDLNVLSDSTAPLERMALLDGNLFLLSKDAQYVMRHDGTMTSKNTSVALISQYEMKMSPKPIEGEKRIFYLTEDSGCTGVNAYYSAGTVNEAYDSIELSQRISRLIPSGSKAFCYIKNDNQLYVLGPDGKTIYGYRWLYDGDDLVMSSWYTWKMSNVFNDILADGHDIYLLGETACEKISLDIDYDFESEVGSSGYRMYIDNKLEYIPPDGHKLPQVDAIINIRGLTVFNAYYYLELNDPILSIFDATGHIREGTSLIIGTTYFDHTSNITVDCLPENPLGTLIRFGGLPPEDMSRLYLKIPNDEDNLYYKVTTAVPPDDPDYIYIRSIAYRYDVRFLMSMLSGTNLYTSRLISSPLYKKGFTQSGALYTQTDGRTVLDGYDLQYEESGLITAKITRTDTGQTNTYNKIARVLSDPQLTISKIPVDSGNFHIPIRGDTSRLQLEISTEGVYPCTLIQGEWKGRLYKHGRRI